jgi:MarR family transcriptional regulator, transcriptional regulator for hemolysin
MTQHIDLPQDLGFLIYEVSRLVRRDFDRRVSSLGLTQIQWRALAHIARNEGCNQASLAEILEVQPMTLSRLLDRLQQSGWIERHPNPTDRRAMQIRLATKVKPLIDKMRALGQETRQLSLADISLAEQQLLRDLLKRIKTNLQNA